MQVRVQYIIVVVDLYTCILELLPERAMQSKCYSLIHMHNYALLLQICVGCYSGSDIAIAVVVSTLIDCLLVAPVIIAALVFCWRNQRYRMCL